MIGEPHVVERNVQRLLRVVVECLFDVLQHVCGLAYATGTLDGNQPVSPVDLVIQVAVDVGFYPPYCSQRSPV